MRLVAFLRAINVGGHVVKMDHLRGLFDSFGLEKVETFIASGNVLFNASEKKASGLIEVIENGLEANLGYKVAVFIRTPTELNSIAGYLPFDQVEFSSAVAFNIGFLSQEPGESRQKLLDLQTEIDRLHLHGREIYWLCQRKQSQSTLSNAVFEKALGSQSTLRGFNTVRKIDTLLSMQTG